MAALRVSNLTIRGVLTSSATGRGGDDPVKAVRWRDLRSAVRWRDLRSLEGSPRESPPPKPGCRSDGGGRGTPRRPTLNVTTDPQPGTRPRRHLFSRTPSGLVPNVVGRAFLREAEVTVNAACHRRRAGRRTTGSDTDGIRHGSCPAPRARCGAAFPALEVSVLEEPSSVELEQLCRQGILDLALLAAPADATTSTTRSSS